MRKADIRFTAGDFIDFENSIVVVIDVLRASSTIVTALANGCSAIIPVGSLSESLKTAAEFDDALLAGERDSIKPAHFDLGNSPLEYTGKRVKGRTIVFTTTNGTKALKSIENASEVLIGSFLNLLQVARYLSTGKQDVAFYCAGTNGQFSLEDTLCATLILRKILKEQEAMRLSDSAKWSLEASLKFIRPQDENNAAEILRVIKTSAHAKTLINSGFEKDVSYCARLNEIKIIPRLKEGKLIK
ncbi:MAG: 2-phosphosulfolactate phosphatase [Calditrichaeota bacterium]|nr:2-phosphosulfolactate phosphatase [Calditrichota bacterium]